MTQTILNLEQTQHIVTSILQTVDEICVKHDILYYAVCGTVLGAVRHKGPIPWDYDADITVPLPEMPRFCEIMQEELVSTPFKISIPGIMDEPGNITTFPRISLKGVDPRIIHVDVFPQIGITSDEVEQVAFTNQLTEIKTKYRDKRKAEAQKVTSAKSLAKKVFVSVQTAGIEPDKLLKEFQQLCQRYNYETSDYVTNPCGHYGTKNIIRKEVFGKPTRIPYANITIPAPEKIEEYLTHYYGDYMQYPPQDVIDKGLKYTAVIEGDFDEQAL